MYYSLDVVHPLDCGVGVLILGELDEPETTTTASIAVLDDNLTSTVSLSCRDVESVEGDIQLPRLGRILRIWREGRYRPCAMQGHCAFVRR